MIRIQPDEGFALGINSKIPGPRVRIDPVKMDFRYSSTFGGTSPEAYERLLLDVMHGDRHAVHAPRRRRDVMAMGDADPRSVAGTGRRGVPTYEAGEWGPPEADRLIEATGRQWRAL